MKEQAILPVASGLASAQVGRLPTGNFVARQQKLGGENGQIDKKSISSCKFLLSGLVFSAFEGYYKQKTHVKQTR